VNVAYLVLRCLVYPAAILFHPFAIARGLLVAQGLDGDDARLLRLEVFNGKLHLVVGLVDKQLLRAALARHALSIHGENGVALGDVQSGTGQW
jgi:hypothetical protein